MMGISIAITDLSLIFAWFAYRLSPLADMVKRREEHPETNSVHNS